MPYYLASRSGEVLTSRDVRASDLKYMPSAPKYVFGTLRISAVSLVGGDKSALG